MNETQLLRQQCETEARNAREVAGLCVRELKIMSYKNDLLLMACAEYLILFGDRCETRDGAHRAQLGADAAPDARARREQLQTLARAVKARGNSPLPPAAREALSRYAGALAASPIEESLTLTKLAAQRYTIEDWRRVAAVDADSIREERRLHEEVRRLARELARAHGS